MITKHVWKKERSEAFNDLKDGEYIEYGRHQNGVPADLARLGTLASRGRPFGFIDVTIEVQNNVSGLIIAEMHEGKKATIIRPPIEEDWDHLRAVEELQIRKANERIERLTNELERLRAEDPTNFSRFESIGKSLKRENSNVKSWNRKIEILDNRENQYEIDYQKYVEDVKNILKEFIKSAKKRKPNKGIKVSDPISVDNKKIRDDGYQTITE